MKISQLQPDVVLAKMLDGKVEVQTSDTEKHPIKAYPHAKQPNKGLADEFLTATINGVISSWTQPLGHYEGNLALTLYCKSNADGTAKTARLCQMVEQCEKLVNRKAAEGFFFKLDPTNVITPPTPNLSTGYTTTILNVEWHTT